MRFLTLLVVLSLLSLVSVNAASRHADGDYVVVFNGSDSPDLVMRQHGVGQRPKKDKKWTSAVHGFSARLTGAQADRLEADTRVFVIEPDITVTNCAQVIPPGIQRIGTLATSYAAINGTDTRVDVDIAILDTGIDLTHPDLYVYRSTNFVSTVTTANDDHGHGTHCAGIAAALDNTIGVVGVAPGARLWAVKVLDGFGNGALSQIISGVDYVTANASSIEVASMSLGGQGSSSSLRLAIQNCIAKGVVVVVAAGNSGFDIYGGDNILGTSDDFFPASYPEAMTISATVDTDGIAGGLGSGTSYGPDDTIATFSNYGIKVDSTNPVSSPGGAIDVAAPGVNIYSTYKNGGYYTMSGTSMSCPHVSGAVGLYIAQYGRASTASGTYAIRQAIINASESQASWGRNPTNPNRLDQYPEGLVRVDLMSAPNTNTAPTVVITSPASNSSVYTVGASITFTGTATDDVDGSISSSLVWYYTKYLSTTAPALLGTGASFSSSFSSDGTYFVQASVTSSRGLVGSYKRTVNINPVDVNTSPVITITSPVNGSTNTNPITLTGTAIDAEDGVLTSSMEWLDSSTNSVIIATGGSASVSLAPGTHTILARALDSGRRYGSSYVTIVTSGTVPPPPPTNYPPIVSISYPATGASFQQGTSVVASGTASDPEDGSLSTSIAWNDSLAGSLGTGATVTYTPAVGSHTLTATVQDSAGAVANDIHTFTVVAAPPPTTPLTVTVAANKAAYKNKEKAILTATVTVSGSGVSGATCNFTVRGSSGKTVYKTVTTTTAGTAQFQLSINKAQLGSGTATVTVNASKTGYTAAQGSTTFTIL